MDYLAYGVRYLNHFIDSVKYTYSCITELCSTGYKQANANTLVFYHNNPTPYITSFIKMNDKNNGVILWKFDMNKNLFYQYDCYEKDSKKLPIMTAHIEIYQSNGNKDKIYLDDFIHSIRIEQSNQDFPTLQHIIEVYAYKNGIVFDRNKKHDFCYIDNNVNEIKLDLFKGIFPF